MLPLGAASVEALTGRMPRARLTPRHPLALGSPPTARYTTIRASESSGTKSGSPVSIASVPILVARSGSAST